MKKERIIHFWLELKRFLESHPPNEEGSGPLEKETFLVMVATGLLRYNADPSCKESVFELVEVLWDKRAPSGTILELFGHPDRGDFSQYITALID